MDIYIFYPKNVSLLRMENENKINPLSNLVQIKT